MDKIPPHDFVPDPRGGSHLCASCKLPEAFSVHHRIVRAPIRPTVLK